MRSYRELKVWELAMELAERIYSGTKAFPSEERFGLTAQLRRSAISVPSNIAEGCARESTREFLRFISIAMGSIAEIETQCELGARLDFFRGEDDEDIRKKADEVGRMLRGLQKALKKKL